jgi:hypothetical protein
MKCVFQLADDRHYPGLNAHPMRGHHGVYEAYVDSGNRVTFEYSEDGEIVMRKHCNHDILRRP